MGRLSSYMQHYCHVDSIDPKSNVEMLISLLTNTVRFSNIQKKLIEVKHSINSYEYRIKSLPNDTMLKAASGIIWIFNTYNLDVIQMANGNLVSRNINLKYSNTSKSKKSLDYEDLMYISRASLQMGLFATAIKFLVASILLHKNNQSAICYNRKDDGNCNATQPYRSLKHDKFIKVNN